MKPGACRPVRGIGTRQRGVVLVMGLVLLAALSLVALWAARRSIVGERVSQALQARTTAFQAAETALRYCEDQVLRNGKVVDGPVTLPTAASLDGTAVGLWQDRAHWEPDAGLAVEVGASLVGPSGPAARALPRSPRCMVESLRLDSDDGAHREAFVVTAIGYSADYRTVEAGQPAAGGEVWLQSTLTKE